MLNAESAFNLTYRSLYEPEPMGSREVQGPAQSHQLPPVAQWQSLGWAEQVLGHL